ncbi:DUF87 domain-containing protein [Xanthomonas axonopodis pv. begoniae]|nr:DUF87 domain-containing protein [Xanthomonas axonopodis pv. begoniae]MBO9773340.1 DUF87 domain-containing protein [Xanthomonas axonopodis pv. begoniae]PPT30985.1 ATPase [Xanthomonas axonopodis pv. begoniae]
MNYMVEKVLSDNLLSRLIGVAERSFVGYVYRVSYDECLVQTNDAFKKNVNGLPHNSFLVAAGFDPANFSASDEVDREVVLLRVLGPSPLPQDGDLVRTRIEHHQRRLEAEKYPIGPNDGLDPMTANELQWGGMRCRVLGTFYVDANGNLRLGSDLENFMSLSRMRAYKPRDNALEMIVNHINPEVKAKAREEALKAGFKDTPNPIDIGEVRYTSTDRLHRQVEKERVQVRIQPADFLARRTAVLGMTRTGKSNTVKTTVSSVALAAMKSDILVGQLIFDVNGEYANANHQDDGSSIAEVFGSNRVVRYRAMETPGFEDLRTNFYQEPGQAIGLIQSLFKADPPPFSGQDLDAFLGTSLSEPDKREKGDHLRWERHVAVFQCMLSKAGYKVPDGLKVRVPVENTIVTQVKSVFGEIEVPSANQVSVEDASEWFELIRKANIALKDQQSENNQVTIGLKSSTPGKAWVDATLEAFLNMLARETSRKQAFGGYRPLLGYKPYHSSKRGADVIKEVIDHLSKGKIVILDLSVGPVEIREVLSERIARQIFERQMNQLNSGEVPQNIVLYVEEAHNLIGKKAELKATWPRIAKEGAKAKIAFVYATQEPSSVHPNILANTENWFVTHLNNDDELKTIGKFYDFGDFLPSLKAAQDVGFARIKTLSAPFVIPTQINRFTPDVIKKEMEQIGLDHSSLPVGRS